MPPNAENITEESENIGLSQSIGIIPPSVDPMNKKR
jgi:hypothetical protein